MIKALVTITILIGFLTSKGQQVVDPCFYSVPTGTEFSNSSDIANDGPAGGGDMVKYENGTWSGAQSGSGLNLAPPVNCDAVKAIFLRPNGNGAEAVGFRLNQALSAGVNYGFSFTFASHGTGSDGSFPLKVYTTATPSLFNGGVAEGVQVATIGPFGSTWEDYSYLANASAIQTGHQWIWLVADESSGVIVNQCQVADGEIMLDLPSVTQLCEGETVILGDPSLAGNSPTWNTGAISAEITVTTSGYYSVSASNTCNSVTDGTNVIVYGDPIMIPENDSTICLGNLLEFRTEGLNTQNLWSDGSTDSLFFAGEPGMYGVTVTDDCGTASYMIEVSLDSLPVFNLGADTALCADENLTLDATIDNPDAIYAWSTGAATPMLDVTPNESATYVAEVTNSCGTTTDAIYIEYSLLPVDVLQGGYELCFGVTLELNVGSVEGTYVWKDGSTTPTYQVPTPGIHWVTIADDDDCWETTIYTEVSVIPCECPMFMPSSFTPNGDGINDVWAPVFECAPYDYHVDIYDRWGRIIYEITDPSITWNGKIGGEELRDGVYTYRLFYREIYDGIPIIKHGHVVVLHE